MVAFLQQKYLIVKILEIMRNLKLFGDLPAVIIQLPWYFMLYNLYLHLAATWFCHEYAE